jgi:hypothetical protein
MVGTMELTLKDSIQRRVLINVYIVECIFESKDPNNEGVRYAKIKTTGSREIEVEEAYEDVKFEFFQKFNPNRVVNV